MNIAPTSEFLEACRQVLGDIEMTSAVVIGAMRDDRLSYEIRKAHAEIVDRKQAEGSA